MIAEVVGVVATAGTAAMLCIATLVYCWRIRRFRRERR
jgi:hypothetical protein